MHPMLIKAAVMAGVYVVKEVAIRTTATDPEHAKRLRQTWAITSRHHTNPIANGVSDVITRILR